MRRAIASFFWAALFSVSFAGTDENAPAATENTKSDAGAIKIVFLGDPFDENFGLSKKKTYPYLVVERLNARFAARRMAKRVAALHGFSNPTGAEALARLRESLSDKPRILVLAVRANETDLEAIVALAKKEGIRTVLVGVPNSPESEAAYPRIAKKHDLTFIAPPANEKGHAKFSDALFRELEDLLTEGH